MDGQGTLSQDPYRLVGLRLHAQGWNVVSFDLPCHGADRRPGEPPEMKGWAARTRAGEDWIAPFAAKARCVLDYAVRKGLADPARLAVAGTSRGGFMALQLAVRLPDLRAAAAFATVTDLTALYEFDGLHELPRVQAWRLESNADALAGRPVWLIIGEQDERVGTDRTVSLARSLGDAAKAKGIAPAVCFTLANSIGHRSFPEWHDLAADWFQTVITPA
jgi:pimeloyl-ACP methyl ester carboxylesterase